MKKHLLFLIVFSISFLIQAQINSSEITQDVVIKGKSIKIERPDVAGGWARGTYFYQFGNLSTRIAGYGLQGSAGSPSLLYLAHGESPWRSGLGLYVKTDGNVGVGTINPIATSESNPIKTRIHVKAESVAGDVEVARFQGGRDADNTAAVVRINHANDRGLYLKGGRRIGDRSFAELGIIGTAGNLESPSIIFNDTGNVGIGTTTPEETLHVNGNIRGNQASGSLRINTTKGYIDIGPKNTSWAHIYTDRSKFIFNKDVYAMGGFSSYSTSDLLLKTSGTSRLTIKNSTGNVGIGTLAPDEKLTVKGRIHAQEVRVDLDGVLAIGPDYVFQKYYLGESSLKEDYTMPTLAEVDAFAKANHHLPQIPSAQEMQKNGINLKEMNLKLLQKIEELTLYTIQQENKLQLQEEKYKSLESRLEEITSFLKQL